MLDLAKVLLGSVVLGLAAGSLVIWLGILGQLKRGAPILASEPRATTPWRAIDLYLVLLLYLAAQFGAGMFVMRLAGRDATATAVNADTLVPVLISNALANAAVVAASLLYLSLRYGHALRATGFLPGRPLLDLRIGAWAFVAALAPVLGVQFLLTRIFPSEHPVQLLLTENSTPQVLFICFVSAVVVAPLAEEYLFRVLLQGWMESINVHWRREQQWKQQDPDLRVPDPVASETACLSSETSPDFMPWPVILSSFAFALVHLGHGPDPIALFLFALVLGYLYQKTHRIWPGLLLHAMLNAWSLIMLWLNLKLGLAE